MIPNIDPHSLKEHKKNMDTIARFVERAVAFSVSKQSHERSIELISDYLSRCLLVRKDEVALLVLDRRGEKMEFVAPHYLARLKACFPYNSSDSLAGKALHSRKVGIKNQVIHENHLAFFENVKAENPRPTRIEKMIVYPVLVTSCPIGIVEVSRKRSLQSPIRPNFVKEDVHYFDGKSSTLHV